MPRMDMSGVAEAKRVESPDGIPEGSRNWDLYRYACSLQSLGVSDEDMERMCLASAATMDPPLDDWEVLAVLRSAQTHEKGTAAAGTGRREPVRTVPEPPRLLRVGRPDELPDWSGVEPVRQAKAWVMALFEPDDVVCVVKDPTLGYPRGEMYAYAGQLADPSDGLMGLMLRDAGPSGLWAVVNPLDPDAGRRRKGNVTAFRNLLVECDELAPDAQLERMCALLTNAGRGGPDARAITWSGGRSWHAVVRVDAADAADHAMRKEWVYALCERNGLPVDSHCGNPTRLTRIAGATRDGRLQRLAMCRRPLPPWDAAFA